MCVFAIVDKDNNRPSERMIEDMFNTNPDGAGIAWREGEGEDTEVLWVKGLGVEDIKVYCVEAPVPYVAHFRVASCGGKSPKLTHPFPIEKDTNLALEGRTKGEVLFHNGHWRNWDQDKFSLDVALKTGIKIPKGRHWSDTRLMAWLCSIYGIGFMDWINEKGVAFGPNSIEVFTGKDGITKVDDIWVSNNYFRVGRNKPGNGNGIIRTKNLQCKGQGCTRLDLVGDSGFCFSCTEANKRARFEEAKASAAIGHNNVGSGHATTVDVGEEAKGTGRSLIPFPALEDAERLHKEHKMSKQYLKKVRKYWQSEEWKAKTLARKAAETTTQLVLPPD